MQPQLRHLRTETALEIIGIEYAKYGQETRESMRAYVESRISGVDRIGAVKRGLRRFAREIKKWRQKEDAN